MDKTVISPTLSVNGPLLELVDVDKTYQQGHTLTKVVDGVNLHVYCNDFLCITGRSGSGKTTLLSLMGGLTLPTSGTVSVNGVNLSILKDSEMSSLRAGTIGYVFQFASLIPTLTILDNVRLPGLFASQLQPLEYAVDLLKWVGLGDKLYSYPAELSGGQQTRVAFARALSNKPSLLLADEPTSNLDVDTELEIMELLVSMKKQRGITVVMVTHNPDLSRFGNRLLAMERGKIKEIPLRN